jgi:hypothetical protein
MSFKTWIEDQQMSLGGMSPEMMTNRGSETPASDEVKRTNMQPQVDAQEPKLAKDVDRVSAIDAGIEHLDNNLPKETDEGSKSSEFKKIWSKLKRKWDKIKMDQKDPSQEENGLGMATGDPRYLQSMQQHPNMVPTSGSQMAGPGTFGQQ